MNRLLPISLFALALVACPSRARPPAPQTSQPTRDTPEVSLPPSPSPAPRADAPIQYTVGERTPWYTPARGLTWRRAIVRFTPAPAPLLQRFTQVTSLEWVVVRLDLAHVELTALRSPDAKLVEFARNVPGVLAAVDGGYFEPNLEPSGLLVSNGRRFGSPGRRGGSGVLVVSDGRADLLPIDSRDGGASDFDGGAGLAVQCGPRVIERGGVVGIYRNDGEQFARTVACVRDSGRTLDLILAWEPGASLRGPTLFDMARMLAAPSPVGDESGCELALNLDGGPSTGVFVRGAREERAPLYEHAPIGPTPWLLVARERR